ncbi:MAG: sugar O-acyltransferase, partial [Chloroflexota bacterium]
RNVNRLRESFCKMLRADGYQLISYISPRASVMGDNEFGDNVFIFEDNTIQPYVKIGDGTILWSGNHIGHHSV